MDLWPLHDPGDCERMFSERFRRPPPWFELTLTDELDELAWELSTRLKMEPKSILLGKVLAAIYRTNTKFFEAGCRGTTERLALAVPRLGVPAGGAVWLVGSSTMNAARFRMRDVVEFESLLWSDDRFLVDENAGWVLIGPHDYRAVFVDLRTRQERSTS